MVQGDGYGVRTADTLKATLEAIAAHTRMQRESKDTDTKYHFQQKQHIKRIHMYDNRPTKKVIGV